MIGALVLAVVVAIAPALTDEVTLSNRIQAGRVCAVVVFVTMVVGLAFAARVLAERTRRAQEKERLDDAFREIERELGGDDDAR